MSCVRWSCVVLLLTTPLRSQEPLFPQLPPEQAKLLQRIEAAGGQVTARFGPGEPPTVRFAATVRGQANLDKQLAAVLPLLRELPHLDSLHLRAVEFSDATLRSLSQLKDLKPLRNVTIHYRRLPADAEKQVRQALPRVPAIELIPLPAFAEAEPRVVDPNADELGRLKIERYNIALEGYRTTSGLHSAGVPGAHVDSVLAAARRVLDAALALATAPAERVRWWERYLEDIGEVLAIYDLAARNGVLAPATAERLRYSQLSARIDLLKVRPDATSAPGRQLAGEPLPALPNEQQKVVARIEALGGFVLRGEDRQTVRTVLVAVERDADALVGSLAVFPELEMVRILGPDLTERGLQALAKCKSLRALHVLHRELTPRAITLTAAALYARPNLAREPLVAERVPELLGRLLAVRVAPEAAPLTKLLQQRCAVVVREYLAEGEWHPELARRGRDAGLAFSSTPEARRDWFDAALQSARAWEARVYAEFERQGAAARLEATAQTQEAYRAYAEAGRGLPLFPDLGPDVPPRWQPSPEQQKILDRIRTLGVQARPARAAFLGRLDAPVALHLDLVCRTHAGRLLPEVVAALKDLPDLAGLHLEVADLTDAELKHLLPLGACRTLQSIGVAHEKLTESALRAFQEQFKFTVEKGSIGFDTPARLLLGVRDWQTARNPERDGPNEALQAAAAALRAQSISRYLLGETTLDRVEQAMQWCRDAGLALAETPAERLDWLTRYAADLERLRARLALKVKAGIRTTGELAAIQTRCLDAEIAVVEARRAAGGK